MTHLLSRHDEKRHEHVQSEQFENWLVWNECKYECFPRTVFDFKNKNPLHLSKTRCRAELPVDVTKSENNIKMDHSATKIRRPRRTSSLKVFTGQRNKPLKPDLTKNCWVWWCEVIPMDTVYLSVILLSYDDFQFWIWWFMYVFVDAYKYMQYTLNLDKFSKSNLIKSYN